MQVVDAYGCFGGFSREFILCMTYGGDVKQLEELSDLLQSINSPGDHCRTAPDWVCSPVQRLSSLELLNHGHYLVRFCYKTQ